MTGLVILSIGQENKNDGGYFVASVVVVGRAVAVDVEDLL